MAWLRRHFDALSWLCIALLVCALIVIEGNRQSAPTPAPAPAVTTETGAERMLHPLNPPNR